MNPLTVRIFSSVNGVVTTNFLDMCMSSSSTAEGIFSKMQQVLLKYDISWMNCVGIGLNNTSVNMVSNFNVEEMVIDLFYWFDKSTKRKACLAEYCTFCDTSYREIVKHVNTRWLSLERAVGRVLQQFAALRSYCLSEGIQNLNTSSTCDNKIFLLL